MKYNKIITAVALTLAGVTCSCTDEWDEHYEAKTLGSGSLWQAISDDSQLTNFKSVLEATDYDAALGSSQIFTVFAPTNDHFTEADRDAVIQRYNEQLARGLKGSKNAAIKEFVQNHVALYNYSVSSATPDTTVVMMNGKRVAFGKSSFANHDYVRSNVTTGNGILFTVNGQSAYDPNILEYFDKDPELDSVRNFIYKYSIEKFLPEQSVAGEIQDGKIHYLDSVTVTQNEILTDWLNALLNSEDSSYVCLAPTNEVWDKLLMQNKPYFVYDKEVAERDSFEFIFPRIKILEGTVFSVTENPLLRTTTALDSIISTNAIPYDLREYYYGSFDKRYYIYDRPFEPGGIFHGTTDVACSNGTIKKSYDWKISPRHDLVKEIVMEAESSRTIDSLNVRSTTNPYGDTQPAEYTSVSSDNKFYRQVSGHGYLTLMTTGSGNVTKALFDIRNVLSNVPYDVYVVMAPAEAGDTLAPASQRLPTKFECSLQCHDLDGNAYYMDKNGINKKYPVFPGNDKTKTPNQPASAVKVRKLSNKDGVSVDSVFVGTYTFPTSSYSVSEAQVKMLISGMVTNSNVTQGTHTKTLRIDCIVFKPHDE